MTRRVTELQRHVLGVFRDAQRRNQPCTMQGVAELVSEELNHPIGSASVFYAVQALAKRGLLRRAKRLVEVEDWVPSESSHA